MHVSGCIGFGFQNFDCITHQYMRSFDFRFNTRINKSEVSGRSSGVNGWR